MLLALFSFFLMPAIIFILAIIVQLCVICLKMGLKLLTSSAAFKSLKSFLSRHNNNVIETIRRQAPNEEESTELMEPTMITGIRESGKVTKEPSERNSESELQDIILMEKLEETDRRISALVAGQISLGARVASWEESTPFSHGENP